MKIIGYVIIDLEDGIDISEDILTLMSKDDVLNFANELKEDHDYSENKHFIAIKTFSTALNFIENNSTCKVFSIAKKST